MNSIAPLPFCSVCIANYNGEQMLADCIDSVYAQEGDFSLEIIVHDDASTDASLAVLARYPHVIVIASAENVGFCIANNRMAERARGVHLLLLNNDAALHPDALCTLGAAAQQQTPPGILTLPQYDWKTGNVVDRGCLLDPFYNPVPNLDVRRSEVAMVIGACLFLPRLVWNELGGFPEWFESIGEDLYLCCLARLRGLPVQVAAASGYRHRQGASFSGNREDSIGLHSTFRRRRLSERNKTAVMLICTPGLLVWPQLAIHFCVALLESMVLAIWRHDLRILRDIYWAALRGILAHWSDLMRDRRCVQTTRVAGLGSLARCFTAMPYKVSMLLRHGFPKIR
jgi:GT2 family glycosyltransferase